MASDSERDISVGGLQIAPTALFTGVDYAALGHLHGRHTLTEAVRYSGSPLAYSFSEAGHAKGSWLVELGRRRRRAGRLRARAGPAPPGDAARAGSTTCSPTPRYAAAEDCWLQVTLTDPRRPMQAMERLRARFPHALILALRAGGRPARPRGR